MSLPTIPLPNLPQGWSGEVIATWFSVVIGTTIIGGLFLVAIYVLVVIGGHIVAGGLAITTLTLSAVWLTTGNTNDILALAAICGICTFARVMVYTEHKFYLISANLSSNIKLMKDCWREIFTHWQTYLTCILLAVFSLAAMAITSRWLHTMMMGQSAGDRIVALLLTFLGLLHTCVVAGLIYDWLDPIPTVEVPEVDGYGKVSTINIPANTNDFRHRVLAVYFLSWAPIWSTLLNMQLSGIGWQQALVGFGLGCFAFSALGFIFPCRESLGTLLLKKLGRAKSTA